MLVNQIRLFSYRSMIFLVSIFFIVFFFHMHLPILSISSKQHLEHIEIIHCEMRIIFIVQRNPIRLCNYIFFFSFVCQNIYLKMKHSAFN